jgi:hypothetical protein
MLKNLDTAGRVTWVHHIKELLCRFGYHIVWDQQGVGDEAAFLVDFSEKLKSYMRNEWYNIIRDQSKLSVYCTFKTEFKMEDYVVNLNVLKYRSVLARLHVRCSAHKLCIETGRYEGILMEIRICTLCESVNMCVLEDEYHFIMQCTAYLDLHEKYIENYFHYYHPHHMQNS